MTTFRSKPPAGLQLREGEPLCNGLVFCLFPGLTNQQELISKSKGTLLTGGNWIGKTQFGYSLASTSSTNGGASWPWAERVASITVDFTMVVLADVTALATWGMLCTVPYRSAGFTTPFASLFFQRYNATSGLQAGLSYNSTTQDAVQSDTGLLATSNGMTMYSFTRQGTTGIFYRNGAQHGASKTFATSNAVDWTNKQRPTLFNQSSTSVGGGLQGMVPAVMWWNRCLSPAEIRSLSADPWQLVRRRLILPASAGKAFPFKSLRQRANSALLRM